MGAGHIAEKMGHTLQHMERAVPYAVASRDYGKACDFASRWGFKIAYGTYDELLADPNVDIVYIATPHSFHYEHALRCLNAGKAVICEKAFTLNAEEATTIPFAKTSRSTAALPPKAKPWSAPTTSSWRACTWRTT